MGDCCKCKYEYESTDGEHCKNCINNATDNYEPKDMCKWEIVFSGYKVSNHGEIYDKRKVIDWKFCPFCGKPLEVLDPKEKSSDA